MIDVDALVFHAGLSRDDPDHDESVSAIRAGLEAELAIVSSGAPHATPSRVPTPWPSGRSGHDV